ncbi:hypothetical protein Tco_0494955 [Tanacetum coccineum]
MKGPSRRREPPRRRVSKKGGPLRRRGLRGGEGSEIERGTDKLKITRKQSKTGKHGHENQKSTKAGSKARKVKPQSNPVNLCRIASAVLSLERTAELLH